MRRLGLRWQVFLAILGVSLGTTAVVGYFARSALSSAFERYLAGLPNHTPGMGMGRGRMMLGAAEQAFVASVDRGVAGAAMFAIVLAAAVAFVLAAYLSRPIRKLESAAETLAEGDLAHRVDVAGPAEVAALGEAFNRMADSLESAEELRRRMVADVAHELRNPLAAARAQAEGMAEGVLTADESRLKSVVEDLTHLSALINDLQELAVAEAGRLAYDMVALDLAEIASSELDRAKVLMREGVTASLEVSGEPAVLGDERRLAQVVRNLLSNAARHTLRGSITVSVAVDGDSVRLSVVDTGEGMTAEEASHIFDRFYRADAARASDTGGAGLGLAISRSIVQDHGGEVFSASGSGMGTTVGFTLPVLVR